MPDSSGGAGAGKFVKPDGSGNDLPQPDATVNSQTIKQTDAEGKTAIACEGNNCKCYICGCLAGGTPIALDNSNEHPNHEIKVGDFVMGYDHYKKDTIASRVVRLVRSNAGKINRLFIQGKSLDITDGHPVFDFNVDILYKSKTIFI